MPVFASVFACVWMGVCPSVCVCVFAYVCLCVCLCVFAWVCISIRENYYNTSMLGSEEGIICQNIVNPSCSKQRLIGYDDLKISQLFIWAWMVQLPSCGVSAYDTIQIHTEAKKN